ncbi:carboxylate-amine ligase [Oculatella sp. LEGE 06141]|uniref:carboxylate-amine ligase n=1 Tax=Oculatella sp. LEGE 06141 TaxID=1828648 RepID=UPI001882BE8F|nr:carboxylate-amine ligase [Oculatella sp. LEGE 06141]MBE9179590.1 carboxylate-amine ligase [Oculatella sp. LEGE 06141]
MSPQAEEFTIGVEEEFQIINPQTHQLCTRSPSILSIAQAVLGEQVVQPEFRQSQIEIATPICRSLQEVRTQLLHLRREVIAAAAQDGSQIAAAGIHPFSHWQEQSFTPKPQYQNLAQQYQILMQELVTFGCHVHIGISDREMAIQVMNRVRGWLAPMLALAASSPFWLGKDTGYTSYRTALISRLPMAGPPPLFNSYSCYQARVRSFLNTKTIQQPTQICWDVRPSERFPTLEFRITDMCMTADEAVMIAGLARALVRTCYEQAIAHTPYAPVQSELLRAANWCAARFGLDAELIDVEAECSVPAPKLIEQFLEFVRPALNDFGEWEDVYPTVQNTMQHGTGAARQRQVYNRTGRLEDVVDFMVQETAKGTLSPQVI